jgi:hypothetical protein
MLHAWPLPVSVHTPSEPGQSKQNFRQFVRGEFLENSFCQQPAALTARDISLLEGQLVTMGEKFSDKVCSR